MPVPNLNDVVGWIKDIYRELARLKSGAFLENSSITNGRLRLIGGLLLVDAGGELRVVGSLNGDGTFSWTGSATYTGPATFNGPVTIAETLDVTAETRLRGETTIEGLARLLSELVVEGKITAGNVRIEGGKIYVGAGAALVVIDGATGRVTAGNVTLDPTVSGGALTFANGAQVFTDADTVQLFKGNSVVQVADGYAKLQHGGEVVQLDDDGLRASIGALGSASSTDGLQWLAVETATGRFKRVAPGVGGPGGSLQWPFPPSMVTSEYGPREVTIEGASSFHEGIDFGAAPGAPIPAAGSGTVTTAGMSGGFGNLVVINHGGGIETYYAHMQTTPYVSVGQVVPRGHILGPVGKTGVSGDEHLHFEVHVNGSPVNPRSKLPAA